VSGLYAPPALAAYAYLKDKYGLVQGKDYQVVPAAKISDLVATLSNNSIDAAVLSTPLNLAAEKQGAHEVADLSGDVAEGNSYVVTTKSFAQKYPAAVEDYLKAIIDAMHIAKTDKAAAIASILKHQTGLSQADATQVYDDYVKILDPNMYADALQTYIDYPSTPQVAKVDVHSLMDESFLQKLDQEGFLKSMGFTLNTSGTTP
jgi:ABC-type nitrate/sulfonate/bicarbonate transport system substrate-binding protein